MWVGRGERGLGRGRGTHSFTSQPPLSQTPALATLAPSLIDLDASRTLLPGWPALASLAAALPRLGRLDATATPLHLAPPPPLPHAAPAFTGLHTLVLAETGTSWAAALAAAARAPGLRALSVRACGLSHLEPPPAATALTALTELDVSDNPLGWGAVEALGRLPRLARLNAARCASVTALEPRDAPFTRLTSLCLDGAPLSDWGAVAALTSFPALRSIRLSNLPLPSPTPSAGDARADIVARLPPSIASLNGAPLSDFERRDAARALAAAAARAAAGPPRAPRPLAMVTVELAGGVGGPAIKSVRLPLSTALGRVRALATRAVKGGGADLTLHRRGAPPELLAHGDDARDLAFLGVGDGDRVVVG